MDVGHTNGWRMDDVVHRARDRRTHLPRRCRWSRSIPTTSGEVAERWRYRDGGGEIGVIASVTQAFCRDCTRGAALHRGQALHLPLRHRAATTCARCCAAAPPTTRLRAAVTAIWTQRADRYSEIRSAQTVKLEKIEMSYIGEDKDAGERMDALAL